MGEIRAGFHAMVHQALAQLVEAAILEPVSSSQRNRAWEVSGLFDLLEALEMGQALPAQWSPIKPVKPD